MTNAAAEVQSEPAASPRIEHAARQVAEGEDAVGFLRATADKAAEVVAKLDARISALAAKRAALIDRRVAGEGDDDEDASALALIDADLERLHQLRILAARDHTNAARAVDERALHLRDARRELDAATAADAAERLKPQLRELEATLLSGIAHLAELQRVAAGGGRPIRQVSQVFAFSAALKNAVVYNVIPDTRL